MAEVVTNILIGESLLSNCRVCLPLDSYHLGQANSSCSDSLQGRYCLPLSKAQSTLLILFVRLLIFVLNKWCVPRTVDKDCSPKTCILVRETFNTLNKATDYTMLNRENKMKEVRRVSDGCAGFLALRLDHSIK